MAPTIQFDHDTGFPALFKLILRRAPPETCLDMGLAQGGQIYAL